MIQPTFTVTVESGVAVATLTGGNPHDWTRDTLSFPVADPCTAPEFVSAIASASPTSFWTPMNNAQVSGGGSFDAPVQVNGFTNDGNSLSASGSAHIELPTFIVPPPIGVAVDSAWVAFSAQAQQPGSHVGAGSLWKLRCAPARGLHRSRGHRPRRATTAEGEARRYRPR